SETIKRGGEVEGRWLDLGPTPPALPSSTPSARSDRSRKAAARRRSAISLSLPAHRRGWASRCKYKRSNEASPRFQDCCGLSSCGGCPATPLPSPLHYATRQRR